MTKIICISKRRPWVDGGPRNLNEIIEVDSEAAKQAVESGFFEVVKNVSEREDNSGGQQDTGSPKPRRKRNPKRDS